MRRAIEPKKSGSVPETQKTEGSGDSREVVVGREQAVRPQQTADLKNERVKRREINKTKGAQKNPARKESARRTSGRRREEPAQKGGSPGIHRGDDSARRRELALKKEQEIENAPWTKRRRKFRMRRSSLRSKLKGITKR